MKVEDTMTFLRLLCDQYVSEHGKSVHMLDAWKFSYTVIDKNTMLSSYISKECPTENLQGKYIHKVFAELVSRDLISGAINTQYSLTEKGLSLGTAGKMVKLLNYLNGNPGLAILISLGALGVSIVALYVAYSKS